MKKILVICGPTATGKTSMGIRLAKRFNGEVVSADSRQVYKGMDIGTGRERGDVPIHGYDLVDPKAEFSVSQYLKFANKIIKDITKRGKLPIIVGGTGLYIKGLIDGIPTAKIPKNQELRKKFENTSATELYEILSQIDSIKAGALNSSDKKNPRRLVRAIEISTWQINNQKSGLTSTDKTKRSILLIGLNSSARYLNLKIKGRVIKRLKIGIKNEIKKIIKGGVGWESQSMASLGYRVWKEYFNKTKTQKEVLEKWIKSEEQYARRQMIWFKKDKRINWFDISDKIYLSKIEKTVEKWYNNSYAEEN